MRLLIGFEGWSQDAHTMLLSELSSGLNRLVGLLTHRTEILFHGRGRLVHDYQSSKPLTRLNESVRHVARHEQGITCFQVYGFFSSPEHEFTLPHEKPLIAVHMQMQGRPDFFRSNRVEYDAATLSVLSGYFHVKDRVQILERLIISVRSGVHQNLLP